MNPLHREDTPVTPLSAASLNSPEAKTLTPMQIETAALVAPEFVVSTDSNVMNSLRSEGPVDGGHGDSGNDSTRDLLADSAGSVQAHNNDVTVEEIIYNPPFMSTPPPLLVTPHEEQPLLSPTPKAVLSNISFF